MPWTKADVDKHKKGLTDKQKEQWVRVANSVLQRCMANGGSEEECAASAIRQANGVVGHSEESSYSTYRRTQRGGYEVVRREHQGRSTLVVPVVMMVEGVHNGSHGPLLHTIDELGKFPEAWNGIPVVIDHPEVNGQNISANHPDVIDSRLVGRVYNTRVNGQKLVAQLWLDEERLRQISSVVLAQIEAGEPIEVSLGMFTEELTTEGEWNGEQYEAIAKGHRPDHLALLPGGVGACSVADGCGIRANKKGGELMETDAQVSAMEKKRKELGMSVSEFYAVPRDPPSDSKLPIFDEAHVRNAMARFNQVEGLTPAEKATARRKILARARHFGIDTSGFEENSAYLENEFLQCAKILTQDGFSIMAMSNYEGGYRELVDAARQKIDSMDSENVIHFLHDVFDDAIIYEVRMRVGGSKLYRQGYTFENGVVELQGSPEEVRRKVEYIAMAEGSGMKRTKNEISNNKKGGTKMANDAEKCAPCIKEKVNALIANSGGKYTEDDREALEALSEELLDKISTPIEKEVVKEVEKRVEVNKLSPEDLAALEFGKRQLKERRDAWIRTIQNNSEKGVWTEDELKVMSDTMLEKLAKTVRKEEVVDYSLSGVSTFVSNSSTEIEPLYPAGIEVNEKK